MMLQQTSRNKISYYFFFLIILTTLHNTQLVNILKKYFEIKEVVVLGVNPHEKLKIINTLDIDDYTNLFFLKKNNLEYKMNTFKFIDSYNIKKLYPSVLEVSLTKTNILAITYINGHKYFVGENGKFINFEEIKIKKKLPIIFGKFSIINFLDLQKILKDNGINIFNIDNFFFHKNGRWDLKFNNGVILMLPKKNIEIAIKNYKEILKLNNLNNNKKYDLRISNRIVISHE